MSGSNRQSNRDHTPNINKYLQRIEKLIGNRGRSPSPINNRSNKPIKTQNLDHYLKYQFTFKILHNFFDKGNKALMRHFFNNLRVFQHHKVQTKSDCPHVTVDVGIASKMLINLVKTLFKLRMKSHFDEIKASNPSLIKQSRKTALSQVSDRSNRNKGNNNSNNKSQYYLLCVGLKTIAMNRIRQSFIKIQCLNIQQSHSQSNLMAPNKSNSSLRYKSLPKQHNKFELCLTVAKVFERKRAQAYLSIKDRVSQNESRLMSVVQKARIKNKNNAIDMFRMMTAQIKYSHIYQATNKLNMVLVILIFKSKTQAFTKLKQCESTKRKIQSMAKAIGKSAVKQQYASFYRIKELQYQGGGSLPRRSNEKIQYVIQPIEEEEQSKQRMSFMKYVKVIGNMLRIIDYNPLKESFQRLKQHKNKNKQHRQSLASAVRKLYLLTIIPSFIKIKLSKKHKLQLQVQQNDWIKDANAFLQERQNFQHKIYQGFSKLQNTLGKHHQSQDNFKTTISPTFKNTTNIKKIA